MLRELVAKLVIQVQGAQQTKKVDGAVNGLKNSLTKTKKAADSAEQSMRQFVAAAAGLLGIMSGLRKMIQVNEMFARFRAQLIALTGSTAEANRELRFIRDFTLTTPFQIEDVTNAFIGLRQGGLVPTMDELKGLGNLAATMGGELSHLQRGLVNAARGRPMLLGGFFKSAAFIDREDETKIRLTIAGEDVLLSRDLHEMTRQLAELGNTQFSGAMTRFMDVIPGALSNLADFVTEFYRVAGEETAFNDTFVRFTEVLRDILAHKDVARLVGVTFARAFSVLNGILEFAEKHLYAFIILLGGISFGAAAGAIYVLVGAVTKLVIGLGAASMAANGLVLLFLLLAFIAEDIYVFFKGGKSMIGELVEALDFFTDPVEFRALMGEEQWTDDLMRGIDGFMAWISGDGSAEAELFGESIGEAFKESLNSTIEWLIEKLADGLELTLLTLGVGFVEIINALPLPGVDDIDTSAETRRINQILGLEEEGMDNLTPEVTWGDLWEDVNQIRFPERTDGIGGMDWTEIFMPLQQLDTIANMARERAAAQYPDGLPSTLATDIVSMARGVGYRAGGAEWQKQANVVESLTINLAVPEGESADGLANKIQQAVLDGLRDVMNETGSLVTDEGVV